jgi:hypothetical protein
MKTSILILAVLLTGATTITQAQIIPNFDFGLKAGVNLSKLSEENGFSSNNRSGYLAGIWARAGAMGLHIQPELYYTLKTTDIKDDNGQSSSVDFNSVDLPILVGKKMGALGIGVRFNTGPVVSFLISEEQSFNDAIGNAARFRYRDQALAWQLGVGLDIRKVSFDLRYEHGLSRISRSGYEDTKLRLFNFSLGYQIF